MNRWSDWKPVRAAAFGAVVDWLLIALPLAGYLLPYVHRYLRVDFYQPLLVCLVVQLYVRRRRFRIETAHLDAASDEILVEVRVRADFGEAEGKGPLLGKDRGYLTLVDGWLHFRGVRTEWSVGNHVVRSYVFRPGFRYPGGRRSRSVDFDAVISADRRRVHQTMAAWLEGPSPVGGVVFPPLVDGAAPEPFTFLLAAAAFEGLAQAARHPDPLWKAGIFVPVTFAFVIVLGRVVTRVVHNDALRRAGALPHARSTASDSHSPER